MCKYYCMNCDRSIASYEQYNTEYYTILKVYFTAVIVVHYIEKSCMRFGAYQLSYRCYGIDLIDLRMLS